MNYKALKAELAAGHPVTGTYHANDGLAADELNALNIDVEGGVADMLAYLVKNRSRTNQGGDVTSTALLGRLLTVAESPVGTNPFGRTATPNETTLEQKHAAQTFIFLLRSPHLQTIDFTDTELDVAYGVLGPPANPGIGVWKDPDIAALKALSENTLSRALELGFGTIETIDVTTARAS